MNLSSQKKLAARILKCSVHRVKITQTKEVEEALTRNDIKALIRKGLITKIPKKGISRTGAKTIAKQKKKGRKKGIGRRKGGKGARTPKKTKWMKSVRSLRKLLKELRAAGKIERKVYAKIYRKVKGGEFRNKKRLLLYLKEHELLKTKSGAKNDNR